MFSFSLVKTNTVNMSPGINFDSILISVYEGDIKSPSSFKDISFSHKSKQKKNDNSICNLFLCSDTSPYQPTSPSVVTGEVSSIGFTPY